MVRLVMLFVLGLVCCAVYAQADTPPAPAATKEKVSTPQGTCYLWRRVPALEADLEIPFYPDGKAVDSFTYRVRNRKNLDVLRYARASATTAHTVEVVAAFYLKALGDGAKRDTNKETGVVTLSAGVAENVRLVTITPAAAGCEIRLERAQRFPVPPRVYTNAEQQVIRVLEEVAASYAQARHLHYTITQRIEELDGDGAPLPGITWEVDFTRPAQLAVTATAEKIVRLRLSTREGQLVTAYPGKPETTEAITGALTADLLPEELYDDPVARLMLGERLINDDVDALTLLPVKDAPGQVEVVLTYPDNGITLRLIMDRAAKRILRSDMRVQQEEEEGHAHQVRHLRTYTYLAIDPATPPRAPGAKSGK